MNIIQNSKFKIQNYNSKVKTFHFLLALLTFAFLLLTSPVSAQAPPITTVSVTLAEDANFTQNVITISPFTGNPLRTSYTFSNTTPGTKTLYAKFMGSDGTEQVFSNTIELVGPPTPTTPPNQPTPIPTIHFHY